MTNSKRQIDRSYIVFFLIGIIGSEIELLVRRFLFQQGEYHFFNGGGIYLFNAILTSILGFGFQTWLLGQHKSEPQIKNNASLIQENNPDISTTIPIRKGENILLYPTAEILFFEAYDNYAFL